MNNPTALHDEERRRLDQEGWLVLEEFIDAAMVSALHGRITELFVQLGARAGAEFKQEPETDRLANLVDYDELFRAAIAEPKLLACVEQVLGPQFKLSSLNARGARPHSNWTQPLHCDTGELPDSGGNRVCNIIWMLDDFTPENGATRYVPGSHRWGRLPQQVLADPAAPHPDEKLIVGRAGTIVVMNAHLWHGGTANRTGHPRLALHSFYCRRDVPQQQYQKQLLRPEVQSRLAPELRQLLALDDPMNDRLSSQFSGRSGFLA
ncbi:MAG TPA: phytanoyl-CoA dioxygenase family protein [Blastocatellia bacterium]|nr:phytanoyl-CoA dioxygenase family protein [Blastocatellia bacterium]